MKTLKLFVLLATCFLILDSIWLGLIAKEFYLKHLGSILRLKNGGIETNYAAAVIVYVALITGLVFLVMPLAGSNLKLALAYGALYGFVTYATYDFTNLAVLNDWNWTVTLVDVAWGICICAISAVIGAFNY